MKKYTIEQFRKQYPNDAVCLDKIFQLRFGNLEACPKCGVTNPSFKRITARRCYQCKDCYHQFYPTAGTIYEKTTTPLTYWFYAMYLMTTTRSGVSAKELERTLGVTYKTAWRMAKLIRELMGRNPHPGKKLKGIVEMDETYIGGLKKDGQGGKDKPPVFAMVERRGNVIAKAVESREKENIYPIIKENVDSSSKLMTDEAPVYTNVSKEIEFVSHETIKHLAKQYVYEHISTNTIEGFFSQLKRMIKGSHIWVSKKYLQLYVDECCFRYNNRNAQGEMFEIMLEGVKW